MSNRQQNLDRASDQRQDLVQDTMDHRDDLAQDVMDHREEIVDSITAPGWVWAAGAAVATLPALTQPVVYQSTTYYYTDGHYLEPVYSGDDVAYMVTYPAPGTVVCGGLPAETQVIDVNGQAVYFCADVHYMPSPESGPDCFVVVPAP